MKLRFSIRDLFWLVLAAALATGWLLDHWTHTPSRTEVALNRSQDLLKEQQAFIQNLRERNRVLAQQRDAALFSSSSK